MKNEKVHRSLMPEMANGKIIGYYYVCSCGYTVADCDGDKMAYCPACGRMYEDANEQAGDSMDKQANEQVDEQVDEQVNEQVNEQAGDSMDKQANEQVDEQVNEQVNEQVGDSMNKQMNGMVFALLGDEMLEAMDWVLKSYPVESGLIAQKFGNITEFPSRAEQLAYIMTFLKVFDALMSTKVEEGEITMEELEEARIHGSIHAFYFFRDALQGGDEWEDFFLPATLELENKYQLKKELKEELEKLGIKYDTDIGICTFDIEDHMSIKEIKEVKEKGDKVIEEMTGQIPRHYDDSFLCLSFDFCL